jgi:diguanylate cyclase (GGDEF)-like protein
LRAFATLCRWICLFACALSAGLACARVSLDAAFTRAALAPHLQVLQDPSQRLSLQDVLSPAQAKQWRPAAAAGQQLNFGYSRSAYWLRGELANQTGQSGQWLLGLRYPLLDYVDVAVRHADGRIEQYASGDRRAFRSRGLDDRLFYFPVTLAAGEQATVLVRIQGQGSLQAPIELLSPEAYHRQARLEALLLGTYAGALLAMLAYNLMLAVSLRDRVYVDYVMYVGLFGFAQFIFNGLAFQYLWPGSPNWGNLSAPLFMALAGWSLLQFSRRFLETGTHWRQADWLLRALQWVFLGVLPAALLLPYAIPIQVATLGTVVAPVLLLLIAPVLLSRGVLQARYFLVAFSGLLLGTLLTALHMFGVVPSHFLTEYGVQLGSMLEFTLLSFALAHRLKLAREDNARMQAAHAAELEARVHARTEDLGQAMRQLTQANERLQSLSHQDVLTGLKNRAFLAATLPEMWRHAQRLQLPFSVLMIDVDHFKQVNDLHGHGAGDEALKLVAGVIRQWTQRPGDHAVRYGGEEFLVVLPHTHAVGAAHIAECIRLAVQALAMQHGDQAVPLTVSIGVACVAPAQHQEAQALLKAADQLLYQAKRDGRNRCALQPDALAFKLRDKAAATSSTARSAATTATAATLPGEPARRGQEQVQERAQNQVPALKPGQPAPASSERN